MRDGLTGAARRSNIAAYRLHIARACQVWTPLALCAVVAIGFFVCWKGGLGALGAHT